MPRRRARLPAILEVSRMKRLAALGIAALLLASLAGSASVGRAATAPRAHLHKSLNVLLYIDGSLGDLGFFDSAHAGVVRAQKNLGVNVKVIQQSDNTQWSRNSWSWPVATSTT